ncbi:MAG: hypothetical protein NT161_02290 [Candidatus Nomurabacteria bacterium]|nr:hypothetical protein [Candidatus Nomurabacteria bacterium]
MYTSNNPLIENSILGSKYLNPEYLFNRGTELLGYIFNAKGLNVLYIVLSILAIFFIAIIIYVTIRMFEIRKKERIHLHHEIEEYAHNQALKEKETQEGGIFKNERWKKVLDYLFSINENDWKLAVIEADSMLFDLLTQLGFKGENIGDKLKEANQANFKNLNFAWEVHNIRNKIAHEGSSFELSLHEAKRVIALYEQIFQEFGYI